MEGNEKEPFVERVGRRSLQAEGKSKGPGAEIDLVVGVRQEWWRAGQDQTGLEKEMMFCSKSRGKQQSP